MDSTGFPGTAPIPPEETGGSDIQTGGESWKLIGKCVFVVGLICYVWVQTGFLMSPLWDRSLPPEADDSLAYLVKTAQMESCFRQDCRALEDLRQQVSFPQSDPDIQWQRSLLVGRVFQVYHPLFSLIVLGLAKLLSCDLITAYKALWTGAPLFFGLAFAAWTYSLWGRGAAGIALYMLGLTAFPVTGVHYFVPWNCALGVALLLWARIVSREGDAPYSLIVGTLVLILIHPMGRIYSVIAVMLIVTVFGIPSSRRVRLGILASLAMVAAAFLLSAVVERPVLGFGPEPYHAGQSYLSGVIQSFVNSAVEIQRWEPVLFRSKIFLFVAVAFGFLTLSDQVRERNLKIFGLLAAVLIASWFYVLPRHPADLFMRLWIPVVVLMFGAVSQGLWFSLKKSVDLVAARRSNRGPIGPFRITRDWPILALTALAMFAIQVLFSGSEGLLIITDYMKKRQPLALSSQQVRMLLSQSEPNDRVLYDRIIPMSFFFVNGAMERGAVYYPAIKGSTMEKEWLSRPDLRFAVRYNPLVQIPQLENVDEDKWWMAWPPLRHSALHRESHRRIMTVEGWIPLHEFSFIAIEPKETTPSQTMRLLVKNRGSSKAIQIGPLSEPSTIRERNPMALGVPARHSGWLTADISRFKDAKGFKISFLTLDGECLIGGISFGSTNLHWPWAEKCVMKLVPPAGNKPPVIVSFDSARLVPAALRDRRVTVLDDAGSSVLLRLLDSP